jgi:hypothetical protein
MGITKQMFEELESRLYREPVGKFVCSSCVTDDFLASELRKISTNKHACSYCGSESATELGKLCQLIQDAIHIDFADPAEELPYESREGGYQGDILDGNEIVQEHLTRWSDDDGLIVDVGESFIAASLCKKNYFGIGEGESLRFGWEGFKDQVKHKTRYLFFDTDEEDRWYSQEIHASKVLQVLGGLINDNSLFRSFSAGTSFFRTRVIDVADNPATPEELGSPPVKFATLANRMSAAGISEFYAAMDVETSIFETYDPAVNDGSKKLVTAVFENLEDFIVVDLTSLPSIPSAFDPSVAREKEILVFLSSLVNDFTKPIVRDGNVHIEYVPTQIFTEFVKYRFRIPKNTPVNGILYNSSRNEGGLAVVIFADSEACCPTQHSSSQILELKSYSYDNLGL